MAFISSRIPLSYRTLVFIVLAVSWLSGIGFYILNTWVTVEGDFGPEKHPLQFPALMIHAGAAFILMLTIGGILMNHIPASWRTKRLRKIGVTLVFSFIIQVLTAYLLYYLSNENIRFTVSYIHLFSGFLFPFILVFHIILGIKSRRSNSVSK